MKVKDTKLKEHLYTINSYTIDIEDQDDYLERYNREVC